MCGRYYIDEEMSKELQRVVEDLNQKINGMTMKGDICPSMQAPILRSEEKKVIPDALRWGFTNASKKGLIINARVETAAEKPMFHEPLAHRRCVIPAAGFYEWDQEKNKYHFFLESTPILYLAGIYRPEEENRFVILTTEANESMQPVHDRMPVILQKEMLKPWILDDSATTDILKEVPPFLHRYTENEQLRLEF